MEKQEKLTAKDLENWGNYIIGLSMPAKEAGFLAVFGVTKDKPNSKFELVDEFSSDDALKLIEMLKAKKTKFRFRQADSLRGGGDFIFVDGKDRDLGLLLHKQSITTQPSTVTINKERDKPFVTLKPRIDEARESGELLIADDWELPMKLRDEVLPPAAMIKFGDNPAFEALCFAYFGWRYLVDKGNQGPPQKDVISAYPRV